MYILSLHYIKPLSDIEQHLPAHIAYLDRYYAAGGIILLCATDDAEVQAIIAEDPFHQAGVAEYHITRFVPTKTAPALEAYREIP